MGRTRNNKIISSRLIMKNKKQQSVKQLKNKLGKCIADKHIARARNKILKNKKK